MSTAVITTVTIVFILLRWASVVNMAVWVIPLNLFKERINKFKKMKVMFHK